MDHEVRYKLLFIEWEVLRVSAEDLWLQYENY